jgi:hypothetical protein
MSIVDKKVNFAITAIKREPSASIKDEPDTIF